MTDIRWIADAHGNRVPSPWHCIDCQRDENFKQHRQSKHIIFYCRSCNTGGSFNANIGVWTFSKPIPEHAFRDAINQTMIDMGHCEETQ